MRISAFSALALGLGITVVQLSACSNSADDCNATATCGATAGSSHAGSAGKSGGGSGADAGGSAGGSASVGGSSNGGGTSGANGNGGEGGGSDTCTGDVANESACWTNELGVFVSSDSGDDDAGDGSKEAPFKTIKQGIESAAGKNVYVCVGTDDYTEDTLTLNSASDGIHIYGGFECDNWTYATTRSAQVLSNSNIALRINGVKKGAYVENVSFQAADAFGTGVDASSYGAFVTESKGVVFTRVALAAGAGAKGADGDEGPKGADAALAEALQNGAAATCTNPVDGTPGKWSSASACGSRGGSGGGGVVDTDGAPGNAGTPTDHVTAVGQETGKGGLVTTDGTNGKNGDDGKRGDAGGQGAAAAVAGVFSSVGFAPAAGKAGSSGFAGQGGGGGGASRGNGTCRGASGGAGGIGGCGGGIGQGAAGGGASVGLFSWSSDVSLVLSEVKGGAGGPGGDGGKGGLPGAGAAGGAGGAKDQALIIALGGSGGRGGDGGRGGNGSGGTGGPSYAIVYGTTKPIYDVADTTLSSGTPGAAGKGGQQVSTTAAPNGSVGLADAEFQVP